MTNIVTVACPCPGTPHVTDTVTLHPRDRIPLGLGMATYEVIKQGGTRAMLSASLADVYLHYGVTAWTFVDADGRPVPVTPDTIADYLRWPTGLTVAEAADELYSEEVMRPLLPRFATSSPATPTAPSTSANPDSGSPRPKRSAPSSPSGTAGRLSAVPVP